MSPKNKRKRRQPYAQSTLELLTREKSKVFVAAEREYWNKRNILSENILVTAKSLSLNIEDFFPTDISSTVYGLRDGVAFVRYKSIKRQKVHVVFRYLPITLDEWSNSGLIIPLEQGDISFAKSRVIRGLGHFTLINSTINNIFIPYAEISHMKYGELNNSQFIERAILDFQITLLGMQVLPEVIGNGILSGNNTIVKLQEIEKQFQKILEIGIMEEDIQQFLKKHSFILHQSAQSIPKQKLGEDFVTDFVLVETTTQGQSYILVELKRSSFPIFNADLSLTSQVNHAIMQTREWDVWLEKNKAYLQNKLPGFETPKYIIVIGRSKEFNEDQKSHLRSYNREYKNLELLSYDDVLERFHNTIIKLKSI